MKKFLLAVVLAFLLSVTQTWAQQGSDFQFNDLDFDKPGSGTYPDPNYNQAQPPQSGQDPAARFLDPQKNGDLGGDPLQGQTEDLTTLFSDLPTSPGTVDDSAPERDPTLKNLPGEPSSTTVPAKPGEAMIELADGNAPKESSAGSANSPAKRPTAPTPTVADNADAPKPTAKPASSVNPKAGTNVNRWYWAKQAWREDPSRIIRRADCASYVQQRRLYHIRCIEPIARYTVASSAKALPPTASYAPSAGDYLASGLKDIRQFP
ncbi:MAG: hypothetical protein LBT62_03185 [Deltaproteobacteria bacterium]|jgi:hypothetical protein|nr:hypothetical protein [Deltaproteobacteria bacterium]